MNNVYARKRKLELLPSVEAKRAKNCTLFSMGNLQPLFENNSNSEKPSRFATHWSHGLKLYIKKENMT